MNKKEKKYNIILTLYILLKSDIVTKKIVRLHSDIFPFSLPDIEFIIRYYSLTNNIKGYTLIERK